VFFSQPNQLIESGKTSMFGELNDRTAKILSNLESEEGMSFQIYCKPTNTRARSIKKGARKGAGSEVQYVMNAIIYGPEDLYDAVGEYLTKCAVCLQTPISCDRDVPYQNPQILRRARDVIMTSSLLENTTTDVEQVVVSDGLFAELTKSSDDHLALTDAPDAIATPLYM